jgi:hypothetical protein
LRLVFTQSDTVCSSRGTLLDPDGEFESLEHEFQLELAAGIPRRDRRQQQFRRGEQIDLPADECLRRGGIVLVADDFGVFGVLRKVGIVGGSARGAYRFAVEIGKALDTDALDARDHRSQWRVGGREVDHLGAFGGNRQGRDHDVGFSGLQGRDARGAGGRDQFELHTKVLRQQPSCLDVRAGRLHLVIGHPVGRQSEVDGHAKLLGGLDIVEAVGP